MTGPSKAATRQIVPHSVLDNGAMPRACDAARRPDRVASEPSRLLPGNDRPLRQLMPLRVSALIARLLGSLTITLLGNPALTNGTPARHGPRKCWLI